MVTTFCKQGTSLRGGGTSGGFYRSDSPLLHRHCHRGSYPPDPAAHERGHRSRSPYSGTGAPLVRFLAVDCS
jgi:hypothetical protein